MKKIYETPMMVTVRMDVCDVLATSLSATGKGFGDVFSWNDDIASL